MKVALIHYWLVSMRGGEKVIESFCDIFPNADIFTHAYNKDTISSKISRHMIYTTFIQKMPYANRCYKSYLPLMPLALEQLDLRKYDLVISSESGPSKGVITSPSTVHICYCHTPMRYIWDMYHTYLRTAIWPKRLLIPILAHYLRMWDVSSANRVDHFIANSSYVANRIRKHYRREAEVIPPPVDVYNFASSNMTEDFYLMVGQLVPYKRADLAVDAFNRTGRKLFIVGDGEMLAELRKRAGPNINVLGRQPFEVIRDYYSRCRALIFPGEEDFGIVPVETMASGRPVIAFAKGGILDSVIDGVTGLFFHKQTPESLNEAIDQFERVEASFSSSIIREHAQQFDRTRFVQRMEQTISRLLEEGGH